MSEEVTFDQFRPAIETLTLFASTLPPPVALAVVRTVITHMASATPSPNADDAIVNAFEVFRVLHTHTSKHPDPELPAGWKGTVSWWSKTICEALFAPVTLAVVEGHLRTTADNAAKSDNEQWRKVGAYASALADDVLVPNAKKLFGE